MGVKQKSICKSPQAGSWDNLIGVTEEKLKSSRAKVAELESLLAVLQKASKAGHPSPADLIASR